MDFNRNLRIVRTSGSSYPFPYKNNVLWVHHDENNNPVSEIWDHGKWVPVTGIGSGSGDVIIDTKMSDSSSNAIANKTVKKYVDGIASKTDASILSLNEGVAELKLLIDNLNSGYQFMGVATPETNPGTPDQKVFYIANGKSTYPTFGGIEVSEDEVVILYYDTAWHKLLTGIASQEKLTELEQQILGIRFSEEKTFNSASSILYFSGLGLHSGDKIYVKISGTALWSTAWLYGDAGTTLGSKILEVKQNNTYEITLTSDTNTIGLRIYDLSSAGDVRIDLIKKKGELDLLYDYTDSKTEGLKIVGLDKGYEVISWDVLIVDKSIQSLYPHPVTGADYNLIKLHCKAGDLLRITNIVDSIGNALVSI